MQSMPLTPPVTPTRGRHSVETVDDDIELPDPRRSSVDYQKSAVKSYTDDGVLLCPYNVEIVKDGSGRQLSFGFGAWSTVWKGACHPKTDVVDGFITPPTCARLPPPLLVAIKKPARKDAMQVIDNEAKILTYLQDLDEDERHVVNFIGLLPDISALVLRAHPLSLDAHIRCCAFHAQQTFTTDSMCSPVLGSTSAWFELAIPLITTLLWLHTQARIVHGDIKPGNVLLRPSPVKQGFAFTPLLIDFSSSQRLDSEEVQPNTLSAITREYTAPELLSSAVLRDPKSTATAASDVFSMAVTLSAAATGELLVYPGCSVFQRQALATQGWGILDAVRGLGSTRIPKHGVVTKALERAVLKVNMGRVSAQRWLEIVEHLRMDTDLDS